MSVLSAPEARQPGSAVERASQQRTGFVQRLFRNRVLTTLGGLRSGCLRLRDGEEHWDLGQRGGEPGAELVVHDRRFYRSLVWGGSLGGAEAYLQGWWSTDDLVGLFRLLARNADALAGVDGWAARLARTAASWGHWLRRNTLRGSRRNIAAHYDLGDDFYALFLDPTMTYSAGIFPGPNASLEQASLAKYERICRKLGLTARSRVLEIGGGWGGFAEYAARHHGCTVTTTTISRRQYEFARRRVAEAGLGQRVTVLCQDYRELDGTFDHIVSVEMIEAVGHEYLDRFFGACCRLLRSDGMLLLQAITMPEQRYERYRRSVDFIQQQVFPGGCLPSVAALGQALGRSSDFRLLHLEDFAGHYAETLAHWRRRFWDQIDSVRALGFDERFLRLWHYYLCYCEAGFREKEIGVAQLVLARPECQTEPVQWQLPLVAREGAR